MAGKDEVWSGWVGRPILSLLLLLFLAGFLKREEEEEDKRNRRKEAFMTEDPRRGGSKEEKGVRGRWNGYKLFLHFRCFSCSWVRSGQKSKSKLKAFKSEKQFL